VVQPEGREALENSTITDSRQAVCRGRENVSDDPKFEGIANFGMEFKIWEAMEQEPGALSERSAKPQATDHPDRASG
jgi:hypothetical protein